MIIIRPHLCTEGLMISFMPTQSLLLRQNKNTERSENLINGIEYRYNTDT